MATKTKTERRLDREFEQDDFVEVVRRRFARFSQLQARMVIIAWREAGSCDLPAATSELTEKEYELRLVLDGLHARTAIECKVLAVLMAFAADDFVARISLVDLARWSVPKYTGGPVPFLVHEALERLEVDGHISATEFTPKRVEVKIHDHPARTPEDTTDPDD